MSVLILVVVGAAAAVLIPQVLKYFRLLKSTWDLPGPTALPIIGNLHQIKMHPIEQLKTLYTNWRKYGPGLHRLWIGHHLSIIISDAKDIEVVLTKQPQLHKARLYELLYEWLGEGLLTSNGIKWHKHRKIITPSFHFQILLDFFDTMTITSNNLINILKPKAENDEIIDIQAFVHYCTLDIISETAMGVNINSMENPKSKVVTAYQDISSIIVKRSVIPYLHNAFLFKFSSMYREQKKALAVLKKMTTEIIEQRTEILKHAKAEEIQHNGNTKSKKMAFLDTLLTATKDDRPLTFVEIFEEVSTFMFEGHDTTTSGITFAIYALSRHPEIQDKAFLEQKEIFGSDLKRNATYQETLDMKYLELVIKEGLRMFPSVPIIGRYVTEKYNLNGKELYPGTTLTLFLLAMGYNEKYYPDPHKFIPERFEATSRDKSHPFDFVPFSAGPRNCIGQKFAMLEMKCVLSKMLRNFKILPPVDDMPPFQGYIPENVGKNEYEPMFSSVLTLKSDNGVKIRLRPRKQH